MNGQKGLEETSERLSGRSVKASSITRRILAINVFALAVLVTGLLYIGKYRQELIESEIASLMTQAEMFAAALGEAAVGGENTEQPYLQKIIASQIIRRLTATTRTHAQLIIKGGQILTDSKLLLEPGGLVQIEELPPPNQDNRITRYLLDALDQILQRFQHQIQPSAVENNSLQGKLTSPEVQKAMAGEHGHAILQAENGQLSISVAVPVQRYKHILGALNLKKQTTSIDDAVFEVRLEILKVFGIALFVTVLLSIYLARTIARPLHKLAAAANLVRHGLSRQYSIPDLGLRSDEIGRLSAALKDMTEALWERMDAIEQFAADVAHEIKNPLTSLRSAVETAAKIRDPEKQQKLMSIIFDDIQRLDRLISDIADASRLDSELSRARMKKFDMGNLLSTFSTLNRKTGASQGIKLSLKIADGSPMFVLGLKDQIIQVLRNLLGNAESFSPPNGTITVKAERNGKSVAITVEDEGPGIPESSLENIFNRFYQERPSEEKFGTHSGLGLSISKQVIETHGGTIWAENRKSNNGKILGARFIFWLPAEN